MSSYPSAYLMWPPVFHRNISNSPSLKINSFSSPPDCIFWSFSITWLIECRYPLHKLGCFLQARISNSLFIFRLSSQPLPPPHFYCHQQLEKLLNISHLCCYKSLTGSLLFITSNSPPTGGSHQYFELIRSSLILLIQGALNLPNEIIQKAEDRKRILKIRFCLSTQQYETLYKHGNYFQFVVLS